MRNRDTKHRHENTIKIPSKAIARVLGNPTTNCIVNNTISPVMHK